MSPTQRQEQCVSNDEMDDLFKKLMQNSLIYKCRLNLTNPRLGCIGRAKLFFVSFSLSVFNQGEEGTSWYIILKGSVNVVIYGKVGISPDEITLLSIRDDYVALIRALIH